MIIAETRWVSHIAPNAVRNAMETDAMSAKAFALSAAEPGSLTMKNATFAKVRNDDYAP